LAARAPSGEAPLVVDLGVPANVAPEDAAAADVPRLGMDDISAEAAVDRGRILLEFGDARAIVDEALTDLRRNAEQRLIGPMIAQLRLRYQRTALEGVERLFERDLKGLGEQERDCIRRWAETLARRFAHVPSVGLRDLVFQSGPGAVEAFFQTSEPDLARELHEAVRSAGAAFFEPVEDQA
jgi:glutamyl-tRNA reductase